MAISVDIADRLYDYTDEEKAAEAVADFQAETGFSDQEIIALWGDETAAQRSDLEDRIFAAIDANGSVKRAQESVPGGISLLIV